MLRIVGCVKYAVEEGQVFRAYLKIFELILILLCNNYNEDRIELFVFLMVGFLKVGFLIIAGFLMVGFLIAEFLMAGFLMVGFLKVWFLIV